MSESRIQIIVHLVMMTIIIWPTQSFLLWPRLIPYYYPLPIQLSSSNYPSSSSSIHSRPSYQYDWYRYHQRFPHSSVLYPSSSDPSYIVPPTSSIESGLPNTVPSSGPLTRWFQKPWLNWKLSKFGLRSPSNPCSSGFTFPTLSSLSSSLSASSSSNSIATSFPPCTTTTTSCCTSFTRPQYVQTHVTSNPSLSSSSSSSSSSAYDRHSQISYPSHNYHYTPQSYSSSSSVSPSNYPTSQASEKTYDFTSS